MPVTIEDRPGAYRRLLVVCPLHEQCSKRRNTGAAQCRNFGHHEPLWFVGAWLRGGQSRDRGGHRAFVPSLADVRAFGDNGQWRFDEALGGGGAAAASGSGGGSAGNGAAGA